MQLRSYRLAVAGSILAAVPLSPGIIVGLPMGIWALVVLTKNEVKAAFGQKEIDVAIPPKVREFAVSAAGDVKEAFSRGKAEVEKMLAETKATSEQGKTGAPSKALPMAIASFVLGFVSIITVSLRIGFAAKFAFVFLFAFFAIFLGVTVIKGIKSHRGHLAHKGFAIAGIALASISGVALLANLPT
jgi:hypothetical protein